MYVLKGVHEQVNAVLAPKTIVLKVEGISRDTLPSPNLCSDAALIQSMREHMLPLQQTTLASLFFNHDVVAVGEHHNHPYGLYDVFSDSLKQMKESGLTHLALGEMRSSTQGPALQHFLDTGDWQQNVLGRQHEGFRKMLKLAHQLDIEVVPVDILPYRPNTVRVDSETIRMRDEAMSKNILNILGGRTDRKVLFWVGQHHLIDNKPFEDRPGYESAGRRLKQAVPTITIFDGSTWSQQAQRVPILSRKVSPNPFLIHTRECFELQNEPTSFERDEFHLNKEYDIALFTYRRWKDLFVPGDYPY